MKKVIIKTFLLGLTIFINTVFGQYTSPFNGNKFENDSIGDYTFIVSGHFHGDGTNKSHFPANTLLANLDWINNQSNAKALFCLGDLFKDISNDIPNYEKSLFEKLNIPLINTVGNHDLTGTVYQDHFGETAFFFELNNDIHLILDTERDNGDIINEQLDLLKQVDQIVESRKINNVFIYTHRTIWKEAYPSLDGLFTENTQSIGGTNYEAEVLPILEKIGGKSPVYLFAGSLGPAPASFFYFPAAENKITIIATAIRALPRDAVLMVKVNQGKVTFDTHSLTGEELMPLENYNVALWQDGVGEEPFNWKLSAYYLQLMLSHRYFWLGVLFTLLGVGTLWFFKKRKN